MKKCRARTLRPLNDLTRTTRAAGVIRVFQAYYLRESEVDNEWYIA